MVVVLLLLVEVAALGFVLRIRDRRLRRMQSAGGLPLTVVASTAALIVDAVVAATMSTKDIYICQDAYSNRTGLYVWALVMTFPLSAVALWRWVGHLQQERDRDDGTRSRQLVLIAIAALVLALGVVSAWIVLARLPARRYWCD